MSRALSIESSRLFTLTQVHSARTVVLDDSRQGQRSGVLGPADGVIITGCGLFAAIRTADCVPVVAVNPHGKQVALFHMGWRGAKERILEGGLRDFLELSGANPKEIMVGLGPCIRSCCYEVGPEVNEAFEKAGFELEHVMPHGHLDLVAVAEAQLAVCGVTSFLDSGVCTACRSDLFYSYRRDATNSRLWTIAGFHR